MKKKLIPIVFLLMAMMIVSVSAFVYEQSSQTMGQTIVNVATLTLQNSALGNIDEGETKTYNKTTVSSLGAAASITTTKAPVYLHFNSNIDTLSTNYSNYTLVAKYITVPGGSTHAVGQTAATMTLASPNATAVTLDVLGAWVFDFELTTTAKSVSSNQTSTATITVTAEST
jgi:hypothetical protein